MTGRAPRKFLDNDRLVVNPAYAEWFREQREDKLEGMLAFFGPGSHSTYKPEDYGKRLPEDGAWIRVVDVPHTALSFDVPPLSMWFALPDPMNAGQIMGVSPYRVRILTPGGELWLFPHEYVLVEDITEWVGQEPDCVLHTLGGDAALNEEQMFFLQSRGIDRREAGLMLLGQIRSQTFGWFELHPDLAAMFAGVGVPLWKHVADNPREKVQA